MGKGKEGAVSLGESLEELVRRAATLRAWILQAPGLQRGENLLCKRLEEVCCFCSCVGSGVRRERGGETEVAEREPARWREAQTGRGAGPGSSPIEFICSYWDVNHAFHLCNKFSIYT